MWGCASVGPPRRPVNEVKNTLPCMQKRYEVRQRRVGEKCVTRTENVQLSSGSSAHTVSRGRLAAPTRAEASMPLR